MSQYANKMSNVVARELRSMIQQNSRLPLGTKFDDQRVSVPGIFTTQSIFYVTLPGSPWDSQYEGREINIFVSQSCTSNRFGIVPCTLDENGKRVAKMQHLLRPGEARHEECTEKFELFCETFDEVMDQLVRLASFDSFADLHECELQKIENQRNKPSPYRGPRWEKVEESAPPVASSVDSLSRSQKRRLREKRNRSQQAKKLD